MAFQQGRGPDIEFCLIRAFKSREGLKNPQQVPSIYLSSILRLCEYCTQNRKSSFQKKISAILTGKKVGCLQGLPKI